MNLNTFFTFLHAILYGGVFLGTTVLLWALVFLN